MYLSRINLSNRKFKALMAEKNPNLIHGTLCMSNPNKRVLWRIDYVNQSRNLLLLSKDHIDLSDLQTQFGEEGSESQTLNLSSMISKFIPGSKWRFRIRANPVFRSLNPKTGKKTYIDYKNDSGRLKWLEDRSLKNGFLLNSVSVNEIKTLRFNKNNMTVTLTSVTYDGILTITDSDLFIKAFTKGIGHGKAYGLGMLSLIPCL